ncbi:hypothetical protein LJC34_00400 [Oscillospiraceae bacterium OttesenSCG-928-G22]|nr:hypothetical protein [Oscillospiraceae bacterium OttesenSCG-928-G22]
MNILVGDTVYHPHHFAREDDFEERVVALADSIFGEQTIYLDIKKKLKGNEFNIIPDGFLIDMTVPSSPQLYLIENKIVSHDPFKHIGIQLLKFSINFEDSQTQIKNLLMKYILDSPTFKERLTKSSQLSDARNIDEYLDRAVYSDFKAIVIIDEARKELNKVIQKINANISVLELKAYQAGESFVYQYDTLYDSEIDELPEEDELPDSDDRRAKRLLRRASSDTIIVPAQEKGFQEVFIGENCWYAIRISAAMKERIKYIAVYQVAPESAVTYIAEIKDIRPYEDSGKYIVEFKAPAEKLPKKVPLRESKNSPQGPVYVKREELLSAEYLEDAMHCK